MSKISTVNTSRNLNINQGSAWARGPPATSPSTANNISQPLGQPQAPVPAPAPASAAATVTSASGPSTQPAVPSRVNGQPNHSRRPSAAFQSSPTTLKDPVAVSKSVAAPIPAKASNVQFGSIDDSNAVLSTSPAAPSTVTDLKQITSFGSISAASGEASPASPAVTKGNTPQRTDSPAPAAGKPKKKLDVNSLFQKAQPSSTPTPAPASTQAVPVPTPQTQQQQQPTPSGPQQSSQDGPSIRPPPKHQNSYDSPSTRMAPLPILSHQPNSTPPSMQPGTGPGSYHFSPPAHLRQPGNGGPGPNPPRSPNFNRAMTNGSMRGPPGTPGSGVLGSPRMGHPSIPPGPAPATPSQTPLTAMPPNMMNVQGSSMPHPQHMGGPIPSVPQGQMPHQMTMPPHMWGYYYPQPHYDPNAQSYYWQPHMPPPHMAPPPHNPQQTPLAMQPSNLPTPSQTPMAMPMSPRVPPIGVQQAAPQTPQSPHPSLPAGNRSSFIAKRPVLIKNSAGEMIDLADLSKKAPPKQEDASAVPAVKKEETERRPVSIRLETADAHKKRIEEEKLKDKDRFKKDEDLAKVKAKRDAEAKERAKRDQEEKERRQREQEEADQKKLDEERAKQGAEEAEKGRIKREEEQQREKERLKKLEEDAAAERVRVEAEEKEKARLAEIEAKRKEEEEAAKRKAEEEAKRKEEEEEARRTEEAQKEEAARKAAEETVRLEAEAKQKAEEEEEAKRLKEREEQEAATAAAATPATDSASQASTPLGSTPAYTSPARSVTALPKSALPPSLDPKRRPIPGRLDLSNTTSANLPQPLPSALASARIIEDIGKVSYPEGIKAPSSELNLNASSGKFRYDRDFLMQFMKVCKEKPDDMPSLDAIGLEPSEQQGGFPGRRGRPSMPATTSTRGPMGLGLSGPAGAPFGGKSFGGGGMGQFQAPRSSEERFAAASVPRAASGAVPFPRQPLGRTNSTNGPPIQGVPGRRDALQRPQSGRGSKRNDSKVGQQPSGMHNLISAEPDLHHAENSWSIQRKPAAQDPNSPEFIDRKVKALLNKLTMEKFDSISEQILEWANRSVNEVDGRTLIQVIRLVFEKATDEATWSEMYARLCRFLMERISQDVRDEGIKNADGKPIAGGNLFRKYLLNRCQEDFERGWSAREAAMLAAASKAEDDKAVAAAAEKAGTGEEILYSDEYYASQKAKRRGLGLVKFIGELFKLQMLTERIMHECIKKLLSNVENPEEEEIESLCKLLATVGQALDTQKARNHMDIYFGRMQELANSRQISSRIQYMLIDIIELRTRKWVSRTQVAAPTTIAEVHQKAERDRQVAEREAALRQAGGRDHMRGSRRDTRDYGPPQMGPDGWTTPAVRPPTKAGDLSNFGKISKSTTMQFGPSSVFSKKERRESGSSVTRASSSSNMFAALNSSEPTPDAGSVGSRTANSTRPPSRKGSIDLSASSVADMNPQRKRLLLQPRTQNLASDAGSVKDDGGSALGQSEIGDEDAVSATASTSAAGAAPAGMSLEQAKRKIKEDLKELFMLRHLSEAEGYFSALPAEFRWYLVEELVHRAVDARAIDVQLISDVFDLVASKSLVDEEQFSRGFAADMEYLEDTSTDSPNAYGNVASLLKASKLSQAAVERLADKIIVEGDMAVTPKEKLLKKYTALMT